MKQRSYYLNPSIKKAGLQEEYTKEQIEEYIKCSDDIKYFIEKYVKINTLDHGLQPFILRDYQSKMIDTIHEKNKTIILSSRQSAKSTTTAAYLLWYTIFTPDKNVAILANKAPVAREILSRIYLMLENLPFFLQPGVKTMNKGNVEFGNNSKIMATATSPTAIRGFSCNIIYLDEFSHVDKAEEFYASVSPTISSGQTSKIIITSTPNGLNLFYKIWKDAIDGRSDFTPIEITWDQVPGRDEAWKEKMLVEFGEQKFRQEFGNEFLGSANTLIAGYKLQELTWETPIKEDKTYVILEEPKSDRQYIVLADVSKGVNADYSTITVLDITEIPYRTVYVFRDNTIRPFKFPEIIHSVAKQYNEAYVAIERNAIGQGVADSLFEDFEYENLFSTANFGRRGQVLSVGPSKKYLAGIEMTSVVKRIGCSNLKTLIEENKLTHFTSYQVNELYNFVSVNDTFKADKSYNDDLVMNLVLFGWLIQQECFKELVDRGYKEMFDEDGGTEADDYDVLGFGYSSGIQTELLGSNKY